MQHIYALRDYNRENMTDESLVAMHPGFMKRFAEIQEMKLRGWQGYGLEAAPVTFGVRYANRWLGDKNGKRFCVIGILLGLFKQRVDDEGAVSKDLQFLETTEEFHNWMEVVMDDEAHEWRTTIKDFHKIDLGFEETEYGI